MIRLWHEAARRLKKRQRSAAAAGAALFIAGIISILAGSTVQTMLSEAGIIPAQSLAAAPNPADLYLIAALLTAATALTPLRTQCSWQIGAISGILDENDRGFLAQSSSLWLWGRAWLLRLLADAAVLCSVVPAAALYLTAKCIWLRISPADEDLLPLLTVLHFGLLAIAAVYLPLRMLAACTALPYCYLKLPHLPALRLLRMALRITHRQTAAILLMRLTVLPLMLFPFTAVRVLPILLTAEQLRTARAWRHMQPRRVSRFAHLELHAYDPAAESP